MHREFLIISEFYFVCFQENAAAGTNEIKRILLDLTEFMDLMHKVNMLRDSLLPERLTGHHCIQGPLPLKMDLLVSCAREFKLYAKVIIQHPRNFVLRY